MPDFYFARYLPLLIHMLVAGVIACAMVTLSYFIGHHKYNPAKMSPYECGMQPVGDAKQRFTVKFYLVAMLFILFDVEAVFLYPWAIVQKPLKAAGIGTNHRHRTAEGSPGSRGFARPEGKRRYRGQV